jgi:DNA-directed RNA polymerase subunit RPC12/RpoP
MSISEFSHAASAYQKRTVVVGVVPLLVGLGCLIAYAPFQGRFESFLSSRFDGFWVDMLAVLPMALPTALALLLIIPIARRIERSSGIACPHCTKALAAHKAIVIASRNCPYCGRRVIEDEN